MYSLIGVNIGIRSSKTSVITSSQPEGPKLDLLLNFGGNVADPAVSGTYSVWDTTVSLTNEEYPISGGVSLTAINTATNYWGFLNQATKAGNQTLTGTNLFPNAVLQNYWFTETSAVAVRVNGLNPSKTYKLIYAACRTGVAGNRQTAVTVDSNTITKIANRAGTAGVFTAESECVVFTGITPSGSGQIVINVDDNNGDGTTFAYLNALQIIEE